MISDLQAYQKVRTEVLSLFPEMIDLSNYAGLTSQSQLLAEWQEKVLLNRFVLMVVGDFNRGKSTLINALLGESLLPARFTPCTGAITVIQHGTEPRAMKTFWRAGEPPQEISFEDFRREVALTMESSDTGTSEHESTFGAGVIPELARMPVKKLDLYYPADLCRNGVQIVDSPGLNEDHRQTEITQEYLPNADAVIVVLAATRLLAENEVRFIRQLARQGFKHLFFTINFRDESDNENELHNLTEKARNTLRSILPEDAPLRLAVISAEQALEGRLSKDPQKVEESHITDLERPLGHFLTHERGQAFLNGVISFLHTSRNEVELALRRRQELMTESLEDLENRLRTVESRMHELQDRKRAIGEIIARHSEDMRRKLLQGFREKMRRLVDHELPQAAAHWTCEQRVMLTLKHYRLCTEYFVKEADSFIQQQITDWVNQEVVPSIQLEIKRLCNAIGEDVRTVLHILDEMRLEIKADSLLGSIQSHEPAHLIERLMTAGVAVILVDPITAAMGGMFGVLQAAEQFAMQIGAAVLMAVLGVLNLPALLLVGGIIATVRAFFKMKSSKDAIRDKTIAEVKNKLGRPTGEMEDRFGDTIATVFDKFGENIAKGIDAHINNIRGQLEEVIRQKTTQEQQEAERAEVHRRELDRTVALAERIAALQQATDEMQRAVSLWT